MTGTSEWQHADPCTCWTHQVHGPIIGASCARVMGAGALQELKTQKPQTVDSETSATAGSERWAAGDAGLTKQIAPGLHVMVGAQEAASLGVREGQNGWSKFTVAKG